MVVHGACCPWAPYAFSASRPEVSAKRGAGPALHGARRRIGALYCARRKTQPFTSKPALLQDAQVTDAEVERGWRARADGDAEAQRPELRLIERYRRGDPWWRLELIEDDRRCRRRHD